MSGPVDVMEARESVVGTMTVRRALPKSRRRTVGAWCFVDHFGPLGAGIDVRPGGTELPLDPAYEHLVVVLDGVLVLDDGTALRPGSSGYFGVGRDELSLTAPDGVRVLLLGGVPFEEQIVMWWNFVGRSRDELAEAGRQWTAGDERFGQVDSSLARVPLPTA